MDPSDASSGSASGTSFSLQQDSQEDLEVESSFSGPACEAAPSGMGDETPHPHPDYVLSVSFANHFSTLSPAPGDSPGMFRRTHLRQQARLQHHSQETGDMDILADANSGAVGFHQENSTRKQLADAARRGFWNQCNSMSSPTEDISMGQTSAESSHFGQHSLGDDFGIHPAVLEILPTPIMNALQENHIRQKAVRQKLQELTELVTTSPEDVNIGACVDDFYEILQDAQRVTYHLADEYELDIESSTSSSREEERDGNEDAPEFIGQSSAPLDTQNIYLQPSYQAPSAWHPYDLFPQSQSAAQGFTQGCCCCQPTHYCPPHLHAQLPLASGDIGFGTYFHPNQQMDQMVRIPSGASARCCGHYMCCQQYGFTGMGNQLVSTSAAFQNSPVNPDFRHSHGDPGFYPLHVPGRQMPDASTTLGYMSSYLAPAQASHGLQTGFAPACHNFGVPHYYVDQHSMGLHSQDASRQAGSWPQQRGSQATPRPETRGVEDRDTFYDPHSDLWPESVYAPNSGHEDPSEPEFGYRFHAGGSEEEGVAVCPTPEFHERSLRKCDTKDRGCSPLTRSKAKPRSETADPGHRSSKGRRQHSRRHPEDLRSRSGDNHPSRHLARPCRAEAFYPTPMHYPNHHHANQFMWRQDREASITSEFMSSTMTESGDSIISVKRVDAKYTSNSGRYYHHPPQRAVLTQHAHVHRGHHSRRHGEPSHRLSRRRRRSSKDGNGGNHRIDKKQEIKTEEAASVKSEDEQSLLVQDALPSRKTSRRRAREAAVYLSPSPPPQILSWGFADGRVPVGYPAGHGTLAMAPPHMAHHPITPSYGYSCSCWECANYAKCFCHACALGEQNLCRFIGRRRRRQYDTGTSTSDTEVSADDDSDASSHCPKTDATSRQDRDHSTGRRGRVSSDRSEHSCGRDRVQGDDAENSSCLSQQSSGGEVCGARQSCDADESRAPGLEPEDEDPGSSGLPIADGPAQPLPDGECSPGPGTGAHQGDPVSELTTDVQRLAEDGIPEDAVEDPCLKNIPLNQIMGEERDGKSGGYIQSPAEQINEEIKAIALNRTFVAGEDPQQDQQTDDSKDGSQPFDAEFNATTDQLYQTLGTRTDVVEAFQEHSDALDDFVNEPEATSAKGLDESEDEEVPPAPEDASADGQGDGQQGVDGGSAIGTGSDPPAGVPDRKTDEPCDPSRRLPGPIRTMAYGFKYFPRNLSDYETVTSALGIDCLNTGPCVFGGLVSDARKRASAATAAKRGGRRAFATAAAASEDQLDGGPAAGILDARLEFWRRGRAAALEPFEERSLDVDKKDDFDFMSAVTNSRISSKLPVKVWAKESRAVMRRGDLLVDTRDTDRYFYVTAYCRGSGGKLIKSDVVVDKKTRAMRVDSNVKSRHYMPE